MPHKKGKSQGTGRLLARLFRLVRALLREGVNQNLILAVVFLALSRDDVDAIRGLAGADDETDDES